MNTTTAPTATQVAISAEIDFYEAAERAIQAAERQDEQASMEYGILMWATEARRAMESGHLDSILGTMVRVRGRDHHTVSAAISSAAATVAEALVDKVVADDTDRAAAAAIVGVALAMVIRGGAEGLRIEASDDESAVTVSHDFGDSVGRGITVYFHSITQGQGDDCHATFSYPEGVAETVTMHQSFTTSTGMGSVMEAVASHLVESSMPVSWITP